MSINPPTTKEVPLQPDPRARPPVEPPPPLPAPVAPEVGRGRRGLTGWRGAIGVVAVALGLPVVTAAGGEDTGSTPGAPIEVGGQVTVATVYPWEPVEVGETHAVWQLGGNQIWVETGDFDGTSAELLTAVETDLRSRAITFVTGDVELLPVFGFGGLAMHQPFVATFRSADSGMHGPAQPVEGVLAAMVAEGDAVTLLALGPEAGFAVVRDDVMVTLAAIEEIDQ